MTHEAEWTRGQWDELMEAETGRVQEVEEWSWHATGGWKREGEERAASGISFREDRGYWLEGLQTNLSTREGKHLLCLSSTLTCSLCWGKANL